MKPTHILMWDLSAGGKILYVIDPGGQFATYDALGNRIHVDRIEEYPTTLTAATVMKEWGLQVHDQVTNVGTTKYFLVPKTEALVHFATGGYIPQSPF